jgi:hypothetical protein
VNLVALQPFQLDLIEIDLLRLLPQPIELMTTCKAFLVKYPDQWNVHCVLLDSVLQRREFNEAVSELMCLRNHFSSWLPSLEVSAAPTDSGAVVLHREYLQQLQLEHRRLRGPILAELWLLLRSQPVCPVPAQLDALEALFIVYVKKFYSKHCCFTDLKPLLERAVVSVKESLRLHCAELLQVEHKRLQVRLGLLEPPTPAMLEEPCHEAEAEEESEETGGPESQVEPGVSKASKKKKKVKKKKNNNPAEAQESATQIKLRPLDAPKLQQLAARDADLVVQLGAFGQLDALLSYLSPAHAQHYSYDLVNERLALYGKSRQMFQEGVGGEQRTFQPADDLLLAISAFFRRKYLQATNSTSRQQLVVLWSEFLRHAITTSAFNFYLQIDLLEASGIMYSARAGAEAFKRLGVKNIQHDSMVYLCLPSLLQGGLLSDAKVLLRAVLSCQCAGRREAAGQLGHAFEFGNFNKALELQDFLDNSSRLAQLQHVCALGSG